jgi:serine/threonine protein kinase HipA of HipAB toxin-antitoxin module
VSRLAPLYDLASFLPYVDAPPVSSAGLRAEGPRSALKIGSTYDLALIGETDVAQLARTLGLDADEGVERHRRLAARVPGEFEDLAATLDDPDHAAFVRELSARIALAQGGTGRAGVD